jgi:hypothetical protein
MTDLLNPVHPKTTTHVRPAFAGSAILALLGSSAALIAIAPAAMPASYSWTKHGISESAAQGVAGAWVARMGFLLFGLAVMWLSMVRAHSWQPAGRSLHLVFGLCMLGVAAFSTKPWIENAAYVRSEDFLHTVFASLMGFAFIVGTALVVVARRFRRRQTGPDLGAAISTLGLSVAMSAFPSVLGVLQRLMFLVAYVWYGREAITSRRNLPYPVG